MAEVDVILPTFHPDQVAAFRLRNPDGTKAKRKIVRCGRRWGKTDFGKVIGCDAVIKGRNVGWFAPDYKISSEAYNEILDVIEPVKKSSSKVEGVIRAYGGGRMDFWTLENERAGRSRKYHTILIDEGAFTKPNMIDIWEQSIEPTLLDFDGTAYVLSNTNGNDPENFLYKISPGGGDPGGSKYHFAEYHAPTFRNPYVPAHKPGETESEYVVRRAATFEKLRTDNHPLVYKQEYLAEFVDWSGVSFFELSKLLVVDQAVAAPRRCDAVFAVIDSATKTGKSNDGTGVVYYAVIKHGLSYQLVILDWDLVQIEGASLEVWLPGVLKNLSALAASCGARLGSLGPFIEDKDSGQILLQQARNKGLQATAIESPLTALGKDGRAISASSYVYRGLVKFSQLAYDKVTSFKGTSRNHLLSQVLGFRVGDKDAAKRADDLLDCFTYGIAIALGNAEGF